LFFDTNNFEKALSTIRSIGTALPANKHRQEDIRTFMQMVYAPEAAQSRKLKFLYQHSGIDARYSVIPDYTKPAGEWVFYPNGENLEPFPSVEKRMEWFNKFAPALSVAAIRDCLGDIMPASDITHLITVSCTGMSAPGLDLQVMELLGLAPNIYRSSVNFMGCYAAIHALKIADAICRSEKNARVMLVCTELCTLHFQRETTLDNISSSLLFGDGSAAVLVTSEDGEGLKIESFYSEVIAKGKSDMAWEISSSGFLMTLSGYIPELIASDFEPLVMRALSKADVKKESIAKWCIHPGGKRILETIQKSLALHGDDLSSSYEVLREFGNMSSPTILFVLQKIMRSSIAPGEKIFGAAFGPGLTMETFVASC
jgi:predicted naringenin-chalcone synthase